MQRILVMALAITQVIGLSACQKAGIHSAKNSEGETGSSVDASEPISQPPDSPKPDGHVAKPVRPKREPELTRPQSPKPEGHPMSTENTLFVFEYLYMMGDTLDCYFTAERFAGSTTHRSPYAAFIELDEEVTSIDDLVEKLNNDVDGLTATRSSRWPKVIHLVDDTLGSVSGYAIEQEVSFEFSGTVDKLVLQLGQELNGRIDRLQGGSIPPGDFDLFDNETATTIDVQSEKVRNVLTSAVPLQNYNRVLWGATTYTTNGEHRAEVSFGGPPWEEE